MLNLLYSDVFHLTILLGLAAKPSQQHYFEISLKTIFKTVPSV
ncbi:hypothetical protein SHD_2493 [Shewanella decolorationis S12]|uniref:Uncharacterized protein n=1 Tax=Shewanella decolorationis S12 TaxID=1353536 RepID=A0ABN0PLH1_9GAMM|nr:hypothetical protein SHD_2493 [Shewanella decolorationis S12]